MSKIVRNFLFGNVCNNVIVLRHRCCKRGICSFSIYKLREELRICGYWILHVVNKFIIINFALLLTNGTHNRKIVVVRLSWRFFIYIFSTNGFINIKCFKMPLNHKRYFGVHKYFFGQCKSKILKILLWSNLFGVAILLNYNQLTFVRLKSPKIKNLQLELLCIRPTYVWII